MTAALTTDIDRPAIERPAAPRSVTTSRGRSHVRTVVALMLREMASRFGNRPGGYVWAVLEPLSMIVMLAFGFSLLLRSPSLGTSFILFYASGFLPFLVFRDVANKVQACISFSRPLMIYPVVRWIDAVVARTVLNVLTGILVGVILFTGILLTQDTHTIIRFGPIVEAYAMVISLGLGVGMCNCVLASFFPVWSSVWKVVMRPLAIASGVILLYENLPMWVQEIIWYNPLLHALGLMRKGFYPNYHADYVSHVYVMTVAMTLITLGLLMMRRWHREILSR